MLELRINNKTADIKESSIIAVTKQYESVHNPMLYYADWSKTVKLPVSANNNAIFNNFNRLDSTVTNISIDPVKKIPCMILNNQEPVLEGYCKLENANTIWTDECYEITIYTTFGLIMNSLKLLTFNKNAVDVDPQYIIDSPLSDDLVIDRELVKRSFEQETHSLTGNDVIDWIGFIPTYQGKYSDFSSDKEQVLTSGRTDDMSRERDEHYKREFRSYYQQPFIWVDKLWKTAKDKIEAITDYTLNLDGSWFTGSNPYYTDLIYTCPSLFTSDDNFKQSTENYADTMNVIMFNKPSKSPSLSVHNNLQLLNLVSGNNADIYDPVTGIFNTNKDFGSTCLKGKFKLTLFASIPGYANDGYWYCKITDDNPFYVRLKAVNADTGEDIYGANKTFLLYSDEYDVNSNTFDEGIDLGVCSIANTGVDLGFDGVTGYRPMINHTGYQTGMNHAWECDLNFELNVPQNVPYKVYFEIWNANNGDPFEYTSTFSGITWDWLWADHFNTTYGQYNDKGYSIYIDTKNLSCETTENLRTGSNITLYRVFPKDITLCDVLLNYSKMFGLVWDVNEFDKTITVMTRNRFYDDYRILDWSDRIDRSKEFKFAPLSFDKRYVMFNFDEGDCGRLKNYESTYQITYGSKKLDTGYEFNTETNELMENLTPSVVCQKRQYSKMMNTEYEDRPNFMGYSYMVYPQEHYVDNDDEGKNAGMSGAFYFRNGTFAPDSRLSNWDVNGDYCVTITDDTQHMIQSQEFCWNSCGEGTVLCYALPDVSTISNGYDNQRYSVHFESPKEYYFETPNGDINYIYHSFWENYINERYCSQNKKLTAYVYISIDEFKDIDFREFIMIDNILYHIDKIYDFNFNSDEPVKMDLVQVWDMSAYTKGQNEVPYLFTVPQNVEVTTTNQTVPVYTSYEDIHIINGFVPSWITASIDANGDLSVMANSTTDEYRYGIIPLLKGATASIMDAMNISAAYIVIVKQYPVNPYRLDVDRNTLVFNSLGGSQTVIVDCHDTSNNAISVARDNNWVTAYIAEYRETTENRRDCLHLVVSVPPRTATTPRNGTVALSITANGTTYTQTINVGQQGGLRHTRDDNYRLITDIDSDLQVLDSNNTPTNTLVSGQIYHFKDLFPEEIDVNSIQITGGGSVNITGNSGMQTIEFIPQLSDGEQVGGGMITISTMNGNIVNYNYDVQSSAPTPDLRHVIVSSDENSMFRIELTPSVMEPRTTNFFKNDIVDGTVITLTALPNNGFTLNKWVDQNGNEYTTPVVTFTVGSLIVDQNDLFKIKLETKEAKKTVSLTIDPNGGTVTFGDDPTEYTSVVTKTVIEGNTITNVKINPPGIKVFSAWTDGSKTNPRDFTVFQDTSVSVIYSGTNESVITLDGSGLLGADDVLILSLDGTEMMKAGYGEINKIKVSNRYLNDNHYVLELVCKVNDVNSIFDRFSIGGTDTPQGENPYTDNNFKLRNDTYIKVACSPVVYYNVSVSAGNNGSVRVNNIGGNYSQSVPSGTVLTLQATPNQNYQFNGWSDGNNNSTRTITVTGNTTLTAAFTEIMYNVSISAGSNGSITVNGVSGNYLQSVRQGTVLTLEATPNQNYNFNGWSDGNNDNPRSLTVTGNTTLTAAFEAGLNITYFYVEDVSGNNNTLSIQKSSSSAPTIEVFKSSDQQNWTSMGSTSTTPITATIPANSKLYLKAITEEWGSYNTVTASGNYNVGGNIMSLLYGDNFQNQTTFEEYSGDNFYALFDSSTTLISAGNLVLPATTLTSGCYDSMFYGCSSLTTAPATLPATSMKEKCYYEMFKGCTSLINAQSVLPATILERECYYGMFWGCTALTTAPEILGTSFTSNNASDSCTNMFNNCTNLVNPPSKLPATDLATSCYEQMFYNCTSLTTAPELPATTLASNCYLSMFWGCSALTTAPELPATTLSRDCYYNMFRNCTSLTTTPDLKASTLATYCYNSMFEGCTNLKKVVVYADDISATDCLYRWLYNVNATGDFYNYGSATYPSGVDGIPTGWTEHR